MKYRITGTTMQAVDILLMQGEAIVTEVGGMSWYRGAIDMKTNMPGGLLGGLARGLMGESIFLTTYTCVGDQAEITFTPDAPGSIVALEMAEGESIIAQRDAFMCAQQSITLAIHIRQRIGMGLFGGEGFIMQRITGPGRVWLQTMPLNNLISQIIARMPKTS